MNVLFLTHRLPYAPNRGDRIRAFYMLRELSTFADVSLFSLVHDDDEERRAGDVPHAGRVLTARVPRLGNLVRGAASLPTSRPLTHALLDAPDARTKIAALAESHPPDVVVAYCSGMAKFALEPPLAGLPLVLDMVDVDSAKWESLSGVSAAPRRWVYGREARTLSAFERRAALEARRVLVVSERERAVLLSLAPEAVVEVVGNGVDAEAFAPPGPPVNAPVVAFCGVMDYEPNVEGVVWFAREVWPLVRAERSDATFILIGAYPTAAVRDLTAADRSIEVTGRVESVQQHLWRASVSVAPLRTARGLQNKVLEALAAGLPVVITTAVRDGLPCGVDRGCLTADQPADFARAVLTLLNEQPEARRRRAAASGIESLAWPARLARLKVIVGDAAAS